MSKECWLMKGFKTIGLGLILGMSLTACGAGKSNWKEEVQLSNGKVIVVERDAIFVAGGDEWASNSSGSKIDEYRIRFTYSEGSGKLVEWRTTKKDFQTYPEVPLVFDIFSGQPTVFSLVAISSGCEVYSKYVYKNGAWVEEPLPEQFEQHTANLLFGTQKDLPNLLKLEVKNKRNGDNRFREALKHAGPNRKVCG